MQYDEKGRLTRAGAEAVIRGGGSVSIGGRIIASVDKLPGEAEFARGDPAAEQAARARLEQQIADARKQLAALPGGPAAGGTAADAPPPGGEVKTITGEHYGPRPVAATNAGFFTGAKPAEAAAETPAKAKPGK